MLNFSWNLYTPIYLECTNLVILLGLYYQFVECIRASYTIWTEYERSWIYLFEFLLCTVIKYVVNFICIIASLSTKYMARMASGLTQSLWQFAKLNDIISSRCNDSSPAVYDRIKPQGTQQEPSKWTSIESGLRGQIMPYSRGLLLHLDCY